jgi:hypothetical protein
MVDKPQQSVFAAFDWSKLHSFGQGKALRCAAFCPAEQLRTNHTYS